MSSMGNRRPWEAGSFEYHMGSRRDDDGDSQDLVLINQGMIEKRRIELRRILSLAHMNHKVHENTTKLSKE